MKIIILPIEKFSNIVFLSKAYNIFRALNENMNKCLYEV